MASLTWLTGWSTQDIGGARAIIHEMAVVYCDILGIREDGHGLDAVMVGR